MKHKKSIAIAMSAAAVASAPIVASADDTADFSDFTQSNSGYQQVQSLVSQNIISGYQDGKYFRPYNQVSREHAAVMLTRALDLDTPSNVAKVLSNYQDVDENSLYAEEIAAVTQAGIFNGNGSNFNPRQSTTRSQMATLLAEAYDVDADESEVDMEDIDEVSKPHRNNVRALIQHGVVNGVPDEDGHYYFNPFSNLNRAQFAIMLDKVMKETEDDSDEASEEITITATSSAELNGDATIKIDDSTFEATAATDTVADGANDIQLSIDADSLSKDQIDGDFELTLDYATYNVVQDDDGEWTINKTENEDKNSEDVVNDKSAEKMKQLNLESISVEAETSNDEEFEANIEQDSGVYTSELENMNNELTGQAAFDQLYPMVKKLDLTPESTQEETLNQIASAFNLDEDYENLEVEISFQNTEDELEFEDEAENEENEEDKEDAVENNDEASEKMKQLNLASISVEAETSNDEEFEANIEQDSGVYTSELENMNNELTGQAAFDQFYSMVKKLDLTPESTQEETLNQVASAFNLDEDYENLEVEISFQNTEDELEFEDEAENEENEEDKEDKEDAVENNDEASEKMKQLNLESISVEAETSNDEEFEASIEQDSGVYTSELENMNNELTGQAAFDQLYPMVKKLDLTPESTQEETLNQVASAFNLDEDYENLEVEISFQNTEDELEFEDEAENEEDEDEDDEEDEDADEDE